MAPEGCGSLNRWSTTIFLWAKEVCELLIWTVGIKTNGGSSLLDRTTTGGTLDAATPWVGGCGAHVCTTEHQSTWDLILRDCGEVGNSPEAVLRRGRRQFRPAAVAFFSKRWITVWAAYGGSPVVVKGKRGCGSLVKLSVQVVKLGELWFGTTTVKGGS
jgi:hypothetical protein